MQVNSSNGSLSFQPGSDDPFSVRGHFRCVAFHQPVKSFGFVLELSFCKILIGNKTHIPDKPQPDKAGWASPAFRQIGESGSSGCRLPFWMICLSAFFRIYLFIELALIFISQSRE